LQKAEAASTGLSQEFFNDMVKENMDDFDMDFEDALKDTVDQLSAQG